jgi:hypothetical protein
LGKDWPYPEKLGWKGYPGTNSLAYYEKSQLAAVKSFITLATEVTKKHQCFHTIGVVYPINHLVVSRNLWLILFEKI